MSEKTNVWPAAVTCIVAVFLINFALFSMMGNVEADVDLSAVEAGLIALGSKVDAIEVNPVVMNEAGEPVTQNVAVEAEGRVLDAANKILEEEDDESMAEELAVDYVDSKDFKKAVTEALNDAGASIDDYKDIETILVKDVDVSVSGEDAEVDFELKVYYFNDGDNDEEDKLRSKLEVTLEVEDLDSDDEYEDAEVVDVESDDFEVIYYDRD